MATNITTYQVQPGDNLTRIASRFNTSVSVLMDMNGITNPDYIRAGSYIKVPVAYAPGTTVDSPVVADQSSGSGTGQILMVAGVGLAAWLIAKNM